MSLLTAAIGVRSQNGSAELSSSAGHFLSARYMPRSCQFCNEMSLIWINTVPLATIFPDHPPGNDERRRLESQFAIIIAIIG